MTSKEECANISWQILWAMKAGSKFHNPFMLRNIHAMKECGEDAKELAINYHTYLGPERYDRVINHRETRDDCDLVTHAIFHYKYQTETVAKKRVGWYQRYRLSML